MEKLIYEAETERDVAIARQQSFIPIKDSKSGRTEHIIRTKGKETILESFFRR